MKSLTGHSQTVTTKLNNMDEIIKEEPTEKFEIWDNSKRAKTVMTIFWILTGLTVIGIVSGYFELEILKNAQQGEFISDEEANASDTRQMIIGILQTGLYIASIVVFLNWFRRAYGNLHRIGIALT